MPQPRRESLLRSLLKGISWRIVATMDTIVVAVLVIWFLNAQFEFDAAVGDALKIGASEFFVKLAVYFAHERVWERFRKGDGLDKSRTLKKSISWRVVATSMTFIIAGVVLQNFDHVALTIVIVEFFTKFILYYVHERIWLRLPLGKIRQWLQPPLSED